MITVKLLKANKKINSTKQPVTTTADSYNCELKESTNMLTPVILITSTAFSTNPINTYNYAYIQSFARYYWITNIVWLNGIWEFHLSCDVLASHKAAIITSSQFVIRSASQKDQSIIDTTYPLSTAHGVVINEANSQWYTHYANGTYVVGLINSDNDSVGSISYYALTPSEFSDFKNYLMQNTNDWMHSEDISTAASEISESLLKVLLNPFQYLTSCLWFPFDFDSEHGTAVETISYGWWELELPATRITNYQQTFAVGITIPKHPQAATIGEYLNHEPFSAYTFTYPPFGTMQIPSTYLSGYTQMDTYVAVDLITGKAVMSVAVSHTKIIEFVQQLGVNIQLSNVALNKDLKSVAVSIGGGALSAFGSDIVDGIFDAGQSLSWLIGDVFTEEGRNFTKNLATGIGDGLQASQMIVSSIGSNGTIADLYIKPRIQLLYIVPITPDNTKFGSPLCQTKTLSTLSGFCQVKDPALSSIDMPVSELSRILSFMSGGFYLE